MSSRFLKKVTNIYGKNEENLNQAKEDDDDESSVDESISYSNKFSFLLENSDDNDNEIEIETETKPKNVDIKINPIKYKKPKTNKKKTSNKFEEMSEEEMMKMFSSIERPNANIQCKNEVPDDVLMIKIRNLNESIELQQLYGPQVEQSSSQNDRVRQRNQNPLMKFTFGKRNINWPNISLSKLGLTMEIKENSDKISKWCVVNASEEYLQAEKALKASMRTGNFQDHLRDYPYHINTLLQMGSMLAHQEDYTMAADLWKRIFYVYETISPLGFSLLGSHSAGSLSKSNFTLDYHYRLNRGIFIALFQWIKYLCQRSCFNTALEYCKLLISINISFDPLAIILLMDDIAIRCDQYDFLINFYNQFKQKKSLNHLPNYAFSIPLCYFFKSSQKKKDSSDLEMANKLLQSALGMFPSFLANFAEHCNVRMDDRICKSSFFSRNDDPNSLDILIQLYMKRSINFWKNNSVLSWVESNANTFMDNLEGARETIDKERKHIIEMYNREPPIAIKRHCFLSGFGELVYNPDASLPPLAFDPFPPVNSEGGFDHYVESDSELQLTDSWLMNLLRSLSPSFGAEVHL